MYDLKYVMNQEKIKTRALTKILNTQRTLLVSMLEKESKSISDDITDAFILESKAGIPSYFMEALPVIMNKGMKWSKQDIPEIPKGYSLAFNIETSPASNYLRNLETLHLSQRDGSISKTTNDEVRKLITDGVDAGKSYGMIAREIQDTDPWVFSKSRATLIAVQEVGQAYGFGNWQPVLDMMETGLEFEKLWVTSHDPKVRESHNDNEAQGWIPATEDWQATWDSHAPSKEFRCRCYQKNRAI